MAIIVFLFGLLIGSFLNVCIYRMPRNESVAFPPSHCTSCGHRLGPADLVPLFSYMFLRGRCRYCGERISVRYPLVEALGGAAFLLCYIRFGATYESLKYALLICVLISVTFIDSEQGIIPGKLMIFAAVSGIILNLIGHKFNAGLFSYLYGALLGGGVIMLIVLLTGGMGGGDIQLMAVVGLFLGFKRCALTLLLSFIIGGGAGALLLLTEKKSRRDYIPFGPWISAAAVIGIFFGDSIVNWYVSLL